MADLNNFDYLGQGNRHTSSASYVPALILLLQDLNLHYASLLEFEEYRYGDLLLNVNAYNNSELMSSDSWITETYDLAVLLYTKLSSLNAPSNYLNLVMYIKDILSMYRTLATFNMIYASYDQDLTLATNLKEYTYQQSYDLLTASDSNLKTLRLNNKKEYTIEETMGLYPLVRDNTTINDTFLDTFLETNTFYSARWVASYFADFCCQSIDSLSYFRDSLYDLLNLEYNSTEFNRYFEQTFLSNLSETILNLAKLYDTIQVMLGNFKWTESQCYIQCCAILADILHIYNSFMLLFAQKGVISEAVDVVIPDLTVTAPNDSNFLQWSYDTEQLVKSVNMTTQSLNSLDLAYNQSINKDIMNLAPTNLSATYQASGKATSLYGEVMNNQNKIYSLRSQLYQYLTSITIGLSGLYLISSSDLNLSPSYKNIFANLITLLINAVTALLKAINVIYCALKALLCNIIATIAFIVKTIYSIFSFVLGLLAKGGGSLLDLANSIGIPSMEDMLSFLDTINPLSSESAEALSKGLDSLLTTVKNMPMVKDLLSNLESVIPGIGSFLNTYGLSVDKSTSAAKAFMKQDMIKSLTRQLYSAVESNALSLKGALSGSYSAEQSDEIANAYREAGYDCADSWIGNNMNIFDAFISEELSNSTNPLFAFIARCSVKGMNWNFALKKLKLPNLGKLNLDRLGSC